MQIVKDPKMLSFIKKLQLCPDEDDFHRLMNNFRKVFGNTEEGGKFLQDFGYRVCKGDLNRLSKSLYLL